MSDLLLCTARQSEDGIIDHEPLAGRKLPAVDDDFVRIVAQVAEPAKDY